MDEFEWFVNYDGKLNGFERELLDLIDKTTDTHKREILIDIFERNFGEDE